LIMVMLMSMFGTATPALLAFPEERPVFLREYSTDHYSVGAYFVARLTMEASLTAAQILVQLLLTYFMIGLQSSFGMLFLNIYTLAMASTAMAVMLGCAVEDPKLGQEMLPILFVPQMLFAGFFVTPNLIPKFLRWARFLCSMTYSVRLSLIEEFRDCGSEQANINCENMLKNIEADEDETWWYWLVLASIFLIFRVLALSILRKKATKFF
jgi:ABC-type multidrug transport system permease subunit